MGQTKIPIPRQKSNPWPPEHRSGALSTEPRELMSVFFCNQSGDQILSVDGESLQDVTHAEAVDIIRKSYNNKTKDVMEIVVIPKQ